MATRMCEQCKRKHAGPCDLDNAGDCKMTDRDYLLSQDWHEVTTTSSDWRWYQPAFPGARYRLRDALPVARAGEREKGKKRSPK